MVDESDDPAFLALNGNGKIRVLDDPNGPSGFAARAVRFRARSSSILPTRRDNLSRPIRTPAGKRSSG